MRIYITSIYNLISSIAVRKKLLYRDIAISLDISHSYLSFILQGKRRIPDGMLDKIQNMFDMNNREKELFQAIKLEIESRKISVKGIKREIIADINEILTWNKKEVYLLQIQQQIRFIKDKYKDK